MSLSMLPRELVYMILDYLDKSSIESLALTFNKQILVVCLPALQPVFARRRHVKRMTSLFGEFACITEEEPCHFSQSDRDFLGIPPSARLGRPTEADRLQSIEFLHLRGDLHWLERLVPNKCTNHGLFNTSEPLDDQDRQRILARAKELGIELPHAFIKFFSTKHLLNGVKLLWDSRAIANIYKVPSELDSGAGGFIIPLCKVVVGTPSWAMYIEPGPAGAHCILRTPACWKPGYWFPYPDLMTGRTSASDQDGVPLADMDPDDVYLEAVDFEEWLAVSYFERWECHTIDVFGNQLPASKELKEYMKRLYVKGV